MNQKIFTNVVLVSASQKEVRGILLNPQFLSKWVPEITTVTTQENQKFIINRASGAFNQHELITIVQEANSIKFQSTEGKVEYQIVFTVNEENEHCTIQEDVYLSPETNVHLPLKLLAPIAKHAFNTNLNNLALLIEQTASLAQ